MSLTARQQVQIRKQAQQATTRSLRHRRYRLTRAIARIENVLAEINLELLARSVPPETYVSFPRRVIPGIRYGEMGPLCMAVLRTATEPLTLRQIAIRVAALRGLNLADTALMARVTERASSAMEVFSRRKTVQLSGNPRRRKRAQWVLVRRESEVDSGRFALRPIEKPFTEAGCFCDALGFSITYRLEKVLDEVLLFDSSALTRIGGGRSSLLPNPESKQGLMSAGEKRVPDGFDRPLTNNARGLPTNMAERLIVALDVPTIREARDLIEKLAGTVSFFKIGLWLTFAEGVDHLIRDIINAKKKVFLDAKMFDIGQTVEEGVARAADRGVSFVTVHGDWQIIQWAVKGKRGRDIKIFSITVLTSLNDDDLHNMGYADTAAQLVHRRVTQAIKYGCDGIIASAHDDPDEIRRVAGTDKLLIATPGIRSDDEPPDDHARRASARDAIMRGADYLVVGRPVIKNAHPALRANQIIEEMKEGERLRQSPT